MREAVGPRCDLLFGTHGQFTAAGAIRLARRLEQFDPLWFEEPVPPDLPEEMAAVARATSIPIATGERLTTLYEFQRVLTTGAARILQPNLGRVGGILQGKKIAALAEAHYAQIAPHLYCGPIVGAANIQLATCSPNFLMLESIQQWGGIHAELLREPIRWEDGYVIPPTAPGLGVELDWDVVARYPYDGDEPPPRSRRRAARLSVRVGFVGTGSLGANLAASLVRDGFDVTVHDRRRASVEPLLGRGAGWADSPAEAAADADAVVTCLPSPAASAAVVSGEDGVFATLRRGGTWIEMSTSDKREIRRLAALGAERGIATLEAPVTGGVHLAAPGTSR